MFTLACTRPVTDTRSICFRWCSGWSHGLVDQPQILLELSPSQKRKLYEDVVAVLGNLNWMDAAQLIALVMGKGTLLRQVTAVLLNYITKELRAEVRYQD